MKAKFQAISVPVFRAVPGYEIPEQGWVEVDVDALSKDAREMLDLHLGRRSIRVHPHDKAALAGGPNMAAPPAVTAAAPKAPAAKPATPKAG